MKRFILLLLLALTASPAAYATSVAAPETPAILVNDSGGDTRTLPLPVSLSSSSSSITTADAPVTAYSTTFITATETPTLITLLAGVTEMTLVASSPFEVYLGTGAATASSTPIYNMTLPVAPGMAVYVGQSSAVQPRITIYQVAR